MKRDFRNANGRQSLTIRHRRILAIEKILADEYLATRARLAADPSTIEECADATRRLKTFIEKREVTSDIEKRLPAAMQNHLAPLEIERYHFQMPMETQEKAAIEEHLIWCPDCLGQLEAVESLALSERPARKKHGT